jgi:hypothetical protein
VARAKIGESGEWRQLAAASGGMAVTGKRAT